MADGYVCLWRTAIESEFFHDEWLCKLWIWCLCRANYKQSVWREQVIPPGSFITGRIQGATQLHVSESKFYRGLKRLEKLRMVTLKSNNKFTTVTLCNWQTYQQPESAKRTTNERQTEQPANNQRTTSEQPANTGEEGNKEIRKEGKKNPPKSPKGDWASDEDFVSFWNAYPKQRRQGPKDAYPRWQAAVDLIAKRNGGEPEPAKRLLQAKCEAYAASPVGQTEFAVGPAVWLNQGRYDDDPAAWQRNQTNGKDYGPLEYRE